MNQTYWSVSRLHACLLLNYRCHIPFTKRQLLTLYIPAFELKAVCAILYLPVILCCFFGFVFLSLTCFFLIYFSICFIASTGFLLLFLWFKFQQSSCWFAFKLHSSDERQKLKCRRQWRINLSSSSSIEGCPCEWRQYFRRCNSALGVANSQVCLQSPGQTDSQVFASWTCLETPPS